jgi:hypothetical protein
MTTDEVLISGGRDPENFLDMTRMFISPVG